MDSELLKKYLKWECIMYKKLDDKDKKEFTCILSKCESYESCPYMEELHNMHNDEIKIFKCENDFEKWFENDMGRLKPILRTWIEQDEIRRKSNS